MHSYKFYCCSPNPSTEFKEVEETFFITGDISSLQNPEVKGKPRDVAYYAELNLKLSSVFGIPKKQPTAGDKTWAQIGQAVGLTCAGIAAGQVLGIIPDKSEKGKKKNQGK